MMRSSGPDRFCVAFGVPDFLSPWLDRFFEEADVNVVLALAEGPLTMGALCERVPSLSSQDVERLHRRGVVDALSDGTVTRADFHARFEVWAVLEGWKDVPDHVRAELNLWEQRRYEERKRPQIEALRAGAVPSPHLENSEYLLLHEAEALLERVERFYLWPCNCRAMMGACNKPANVCIRFTNERGIGWEISRERAREIVRQAHKAGLMQTGEVAEVDGRVVGALCNCCVDCCYPHQVTKRLGAEKLWPLSRYVARHDVGRCTACGKCVRRCPFGAFASELPVTSGRGGAARPAVVLDTDLCRGCGVCATECPEEAIAMDPLMSRGL